MKLPEKVAYLKGLMDGMKIDEKSDSGRLFTSISEILEDVALQIEDLQDQVDEVVESIDDIDGDLADLSEFIFGDDFEVDDDDDDDIDIADDDIFPLVEDYDGIGEEIFDVDDDDDADEDIEDIEDIEDDADDNDEATDLSDIEPFDDDDDDDIDSIDPPSTDDFIDEDDDTLLDTEELYEVICPTCKDKIHLTESMLATGSIDCPGCGEHLEFDMSDE
jgi:DNA-directed RNA polymerase subunit RPC12/RpoP